MTKTFQGVEVDEKTNTISLWNTTEDKAPMLNGEVQVPFLTIRFTDISSETISFEVSENQFNMHIVPYAGSYTASRIHEAGSALDMKDTADEEGTILNSVQNFDEHSIENYKSVAETLPNEMTEKFLKELQSGSESPIPDPTYKVHVLSFEEMEMNL